MDKIVADFEGGDSEKYEKVVRSIDDHLMSMNEPGNFADGSSENVMLQMDLSFERLCTSIEEAGIKEPKKLTVFEFNSKLDYFEAKAKKK